MASTTNTLLSVDFIDCAFAVIQKLQRSQGLVILQFKRCYLLKITYYQLILNEHIYYSSLTIYQLILYSSITVTHCNIVFSIYCKLPHKFLRDHYLVAQ